MCLLDLVKKQDGLRILFHKLRKLSFGSAGIALLKAYQAHIGLMVRIGRHIEPLEGKSQGFRGLFRKKCLSDSRRSYKSKDRTRSLPRFIAFCQDLGGKYAFRKGMNHVILTLNRTEKPGSQLSDL